MGVQGLVIIMMIIISSSMVIGHDADDLSGAFDDDRAERLQRGERAVPFQPDDYFKWRLIIIIVIIIMMRSAKKMKRQRRM